MHYPVEVFTGKIQDYAGSRPSAIAKVQVDGELMLMELGLEGDEQAEKKFTAVPTARCAIIRASIIVTGRWSFRNWRNGLSPRRLARTFPPTV